MRKKNKVFCIFIVLLTLIVAGAAWAGEEKSVTLLYTGNLLGQLTPRHGWGGRLSGGLARNAGMVNQIRETERNVVLLDCGNFAPERDYERELVAEVTLKAMGLMTYDAIALGPQDLLLGPNPLKALLSAERLPVAASNLVAGETGVYFEKPFVLVEKEGIRVGILSVMPPASQEEQESNPFLKAAPSDKPSAEEAGPATLHETFRILPMEEAVEKMVGEIRDKADIIVLLSQAGYDDTCGLVNRVPGIDLAVYGGGGRINPGKTPGKTLLMRAPSEGTSIGYVQFAIEGGKAFLKQKKMVSLSCSSREPALPEDPAVAALVGESFERRLLELRQERETKVDAQALEEARELWKLSPREFLEMEMKKRAAAGTAESDENPFMSR